MNGWTIRWNYSEISAIKKGHELMYKATKVHTEKQKPLEIRSIMFCITQLYSVQNNDRGF